MKDLKCYICEWEISEEQVNERIEKAIRDNVEADNDRFRSIDENHVNIKDTEYEVEHRGFYLKEIAAQIAYDVSYHGRNVYDIEDLVAAVRELESAMYHVSNGRQYDAEDNE